MGIGLTLKILRIKKGKTMKEVSNELHISPGHISNLECEKHVPTWKTLVQLCNYYGAEIVITEKGDRNVR